MSWTIERRGRVAVVTMTTNPVNAQNRALRDIADLADPLDVELPAEFTGEGARHAHRRYWQQLKGSPAPW